MQTMTYTVKELLANKVSADAVGWRVKRKHCGLKLRQVSRMLDYYVTSLSDIELGKRPCPAHVAEALEALYSRWWDVCQAQRELEASVRAMVEDGSCINLRVAKRAPKGSAKRQHRPGSTGRKLLTEDAEP